MANHILEIPIAPNGMQGFVAWHNTKSGLFTMRSVYHAEWKYQFRCHSPNVMHIGEPEGSQVWFFLWELQFPSKIKVFGLRVLHGQIGCEVFLHIGTTSHCLVCHTSCEDIMHMLFTCPSAKQLSLRETRHCSHYHRNSSDVCNK
jgi:hypothetical protein